MRDLTPRTLRRWGKWGMALVILHLLTHEVPVIGLGIWAAWQWMIH